jgi:hypothetical protein
MATNSGAVLAAVNGGGSGASLCFVNTVGATAPTTAASVLTGWKDCGLATVDGLTNKVSETVKTINAFGVTAPIRQLTTDSTETFEVTFMETNETVLELYYRKPLGSGITVTGTDGSTTFSTGLASVQYFAAVFDIVDGTNHVRIYAPKCQVTDRKDMQYQNATEVTYGMTITALAAADGTATTRFLVVDALKS